MLIIGIGHPDRSDDGVGQWVAKQLSERLPTLPVRCGTGETADLLDWWMDDDEVRVIDAISSGQKPGTVLRIDAHQRELPSERFRGSSHAFGLAEAIELGRAMDELPQRLIVYGIEGLSFEPGQTLTPPVRAAAERLLDSLSEELQPEEPHDA